MCLYITDDGQCSIDTEPFCHHHDDSPQAQIYQMTLTAAQSGLSSETMDTTCVDCETALRRRERLREHPNRTGWLVFEPYVECDCSEYVLGTEGVRKKNIPKSWFE
jgi:hypothetical protein